MISGNAFDESFHMLFPRARLPMQDALVPLDDGSGSMFGSEWRIADFVSFVHLINWQVAEPERRKAARNELLEMIRLSREDWKAIRAETDNDREWLPGPQQAGANQLTGLEVTETEVQAWHAALQMAEDLLEGRKLLPHFRFADKGINMKRFFDEPKTFDLVLSITGPGVVPYLEKGKILTSERSSSRPAPVRRRRHMTFALWFNWNGRSLCVTAPDILVTGAWSRSGTPATPLFPWQPFLTILRAWPTPQSKRPPPAGTASATATPASAQTPPASPRTPPAVAPAIRHAGAAAAR